MSNEELKILIGSWNPDVVFEEGKQFLSVTVEPDSLLSLATMLCESEQTRFDYLFCLSGVDWIKHLSVVYHLESTVHKHSIVVKILIKDRENPATDSVSALWKTAEFHEREVFDLFGIKFRNHPDLRRILLDDDWNGFPLRKDYVDNVNIVQLQ